jgi:hypothetical protein
MQMCPRFVCVCVTLYGQNPGDGPINAGFVGFEVLTAVVTKSFYLLGYNAVLSLVSKKYIASIFRVVKYYEQETSVKACSACHLPSL